MAGTIPLNTEFAKKALDYPECVVVHELTHVIDTTRGKVFVDLLDYHLPSWRGTRDRLHQPPLTHLEWLNNPKEPSDP